LPLTIACAAVAALAVLVVLPASVDGWTPGLRLVGLRVMSTAGSRARFRQHLIRTVAGIVDLVPFVVPGLLGWVVAARNETHQRVGDRAAGTMLVDRLRPDRPRDPPIPRRDLDRIGADLDRSLASVVRRAGPEVRAASEVVPPVPRQLRPRAGREPTDPVWSDEWQAWVYLDPRSGRWFHHDPGAGRWVPAGSGPLVAAERVAANRPRADQPG
jgi:hypothetical protein